MIKIINRPLLEYIIRIKAKGLFMKKGKAILTVMILIFSIIIFILNYDYHKIQAEEKEIYRLFIDVEDSTLYLLKNGQLNKKYICAGGKKETPSPIGTWKIIKKERWGEGFGGYWLGLDVPWGIFGIHGTNKEESLGKASSHGCIRMYSKEVKELYEQLPIGTKVTIVDGCYGMFGNQLRALTPGMYGSDVLQIQKKLKKEGYLESNLTGTIDLQTEQAIREYCKENGYKIEKKISVELQKKMGFELMD